MRVCVYASHPRNLEGIEGRREAGAVARRDRVYEVPLRHTHAFSSVRFFHRGCAVYCGRGLEGDSVQGGSLSEVLVEFFPGIDTQLLFASC